MAERPAPLMARAMVLLLLMMVTMALARPQLPGPQDEAAYLKNVDAAASVAPSEDGDADTADEVVTIATNLHRNTREEARAARLAAVPLPPRSAALLDDAQAAAVAPESLLPAAVCGTHDLAPSSYTQDFHIVVKFPSDRGTDYVYFCSAFRIGPKHLGTAAHCIYNKNKGGWAYAIDVYSGSYACGNPITAGKSMATTAAWIKRVEDGNTSPFDMSVIKTTGTLPSKDYVVGQYGGAGKVRSVVITGYPAQNDESAACNNNAFYQACRQYSSTGLLWSALSSGYYKSNGVDWCRGHSGAAVWDASLKFVVGVVGGGGGSGSNCMNYVVPQINSANVNSACEGPSGGASLYCLKRKIP